MMSLTGLLYTIPSIALFVLVPPILGLDPLSPLQVPIALTLYSLALLVRVVADGLAAVPQETAQAATALGYKPLGRFFRVELPIAVPVIAAGLRVAVVANVSIVTVAGTIGFKNLGQLFDEGFKLSTDTPYYPPIVLGIILCVLLALALDGLVLLGSRMLTPWRRAVRDMINDVFNWLTDPSHWTSTAFDTGIWDQLLAHIKFTLIALVISLVIALPLGLWIGHTGKATWIISVANALRALPTVGVLVLLVVIIAPHFYGRTNNGYLIPTEIVLVLLAVPPILSNTYAGVQNVDPSVRDAAFGMGMTGPQVLFRVELPNSLPLIFSGFRSATLQVIATATIAAYVTLGGLGRFIYDGLAQQDYPQMISGGLLVAALALIADLLLALAQRYTVSPRHHRAHPSPGPRLPRTRLTHRRTHRGARLGGHLTHPLVHHPAPQVTTTRREHENQACRTRRRRDGLHDGGQRMRVELVILGLQG